MSGAAGDASEALVFPFSAPSIGTLGQVCQSTVYIPYVVEGKGDI